MSGIQEGKLALVIGARSPEGRAQLVGKSVTVHQILNGADAVYNPQQEGYVFVSHVNHNGRIGHFNCGSDMDELAIVYSEGFVTDGDLLDMGYALIATKFLLPLDDDSFDFESEKQREVVYALPNKMG